MNRVIEKWKTAVRMILLFIMVLAGTMTVLAEESLEVFVEDYRVEDNRLVVYVNGGVDRSDVMLHPDNFEITLGDKVLPCTDVNYLSGTEDSVAYVFLVDVSGSISEERLRKMKDAMIAIAENIRSQDKVAVISMGDTLRIGEFKKGQKKIQNQIEAVEGLKEDTNLYYGIVESLKLLDSADHGAQKQVLVVLSDGQDDQATGITREEVNQYLEKTRIPVCTIAMLNSDAGTEKQEYAKILGSFARLSKGGVHSVYGLDDTTLDECASKIAAAVNDSVVVKADITGYEPGSGKAYLEVTMSVEDYGKDSDGMDISEKSLVEALKAAAETEMVTETATEAAAETVTEAVTETEVMSEAETDSVPVQEEKKIPYAAVLGGAATLILIIIILIVNSRKKKKDQQEEEILDIPEEPVSPTVDVSDGGKTIAINPDEISVSKLNAVLYLTEMGSAERKVYTVKLYNEAVIGRSLNNTDLAFPQDSHMSKIHCAFSWYDGDVVLWDKGSRNGTRVNGVPIKEPYVMQKDDIITIGKTELRVRW